MAALERKDIFDPDGRFLDFYYIVYFLNGEDGRHCCTMTEHLHTIFDGIAVNSCESDQDGRLWVQSYGSEYGNEVLFCPFCGIQSSEIRY